MNWLLLMRDASRPQCQCGHERGAGCLGAKLAKVRGPDSGPHAVPVRDGGHLLHVPSRPRPTYRRAGLRCDRLLFTASNGSRAIVLERQLQRRPSHATPSWRGVCLLTNLGFHI